MDLELLYSKEGINGVQYKINCLFKLLYPYAQSSYQMSRTGPERKTMQPIHQMKIPKIIKVIPLLVAILLVANSIIEAAYIPDYINESGHTIATNINDKVKISVLGLVVTVILLLMRLKFWKILLLLLLLLASFSVVALSNTTHVITFGFLHLKISFEVYAALLLFAHIILNNELLFDIKNFFGEERQADNPASGSDTRK